MWTNRRTKTNTRCTNQTICPWLPSNPAGRAKWALIIWSISRLTPCPWTIRAMQSILEGWASKGRRSSEACLIQEQLLTTVEEAQQWWTWWEWVSPTICTRSKCTKPTSPAAHSPNTKPWTEELWQTASTTWWYSNNLAPKTKREETDWISRTFPRTTSPWDSTSISKAPPTSTPASTTSRISQCPQMQCSTTKTGRRNITSQLTIQWATRIAWVAQAVTTRLEEVNLS